MANCSKNSWKYRLFLSADLEDSTKLKKDLFNVSKEYPEWAEYFQSFYSEFNTHFSKQLSTAKKVPLPSIWKCLGDEILYVVEIQESANVAVYVECFKNAIIEYNKVATTIEEPKNCKCHGAVWGAGFPVRNREVLIPTSLDKKKAKCETDFIGFDMDLGFRISKFSRPERLVVSLPVAYILSVNGYNGLRFYDHVDVKGIDVKYPLFWTCSDKVLEQKTKWHQICEMTDVVTFCEDHFNDEKISTFSTPFIEKDKSKTCTKISAQMIEFREKIIKAGKISKQEKEQKDLKASRKQERENSGKKELPQELQKVIKESFSQQMLF